MQKLYYLPYQDYERLAWFVNFYAGILALPASFGYTAAQKTALLNDLNAFRYGLLLQDASKAYALSCTSTKNLLRVGPESATDLAFPVFVMPAGIPILVPPGIFIRTTLFVGQFKKNAAYTEAYGTSCGVIGADVNPFYEDAQPVLTLKFTGGHILIKYIRGIMSGLFLECRRGGETEFTPLATIAKTSYNDIRPNLIAGQPEKREYRGWFIVDDVIVGLESAVCSIVM